jgi:hypothetical protein
MAGAQRLALRLMLIAGATQPAALCLQHFIDTCQARGDDGFIQRFSYQPRQMQPQLSLPRRFP